MTPPRDDDVTTSARCPCCGTRFVRIRRQRYCSPACRQTAYRRRQPTTSTPDRPAPAAARPRREITVYLCGECEQRYLGEQWCHDCNRPCRKIDTGGLCPHCDEPVTIMDLTDQHVPSSINRA